jgi:hypothetical protein
LRVRAYSKSAAAAVNLELSPCGVRNTISLQTGASGRRTNLRTPHPSDSHEEELGFPSWVIPSIAHFLRPFWGMTASYDPSFPSRDFVREAGIQLRLDLDWSGGHDRAGQSLWAATYRDPERLRRLVDFALGNIQIGYFFREAEVAVMERDRHLRDAGSVWQVRRVQGRDEYFLE